MDLGICSICGMRRKDCIEIVETEEEHLARRLTPARVLRLLQRALPSARETHERLQQLARRGPSKLRLR